MKFSFILLLLFFAITSTYSQEFIKHSKIHFKDSAIVCGDFYYYPTLPLNVTLSDSLGNKHTFDLGLIDYIQGKSDIYKVINFNGNPKLLETVIKGEKLSLYKTNFDGDEQFYVLKDDKLYWLEGGRITFEKDGKHFEKDNEIYKGVLKFLMYDNKNIIKKIDGIKYSQTDISPLILEYNNGYISFLKTEMMEKQNKVRDWKFYAQFSHGYGTPYGNDYLGSKFFQAGTELINNEGSRHSWKFGIEYGKFDNDQNKKQAWINVNSSYYYDFFRVPGGNAYIGVRLLDIGNFWDSNDTNFYIFPRISSLMGYKHHINQRLDFYIEVNHLFVLKYVPRNFSIGFSYDL